MNLHTDPIVVFDTETTGIDTSTSRIVEFGGVVVRPHDKAKYKLHHYIHPEGPIPKEASDIHGITDEQVADCPRFAELVEHIGGYLSRKDAILVGYNAASYDASILNAEFERAGSDYRVDPLKVLDPVIFVRWHLRHLQKRKLGDMCVHFNIVLDQAHTAVADSTATYELLMAMVERGLIPADVDEALDQQRYYSAVQEQEFARWLYWIFRDRTTGELTIGAGKRCGKRLSEIDNGFLQWALRDMADLHLGARSEFEREQSRRLKSWPPKGAKSFLRMMQG
jgi:DNA polymerase-3 subunit epsilon